MLLSIKMAEQNFPPRFLYFRKEERKSQVQTHFGRFMALNKLIAAAWEQDPCNAGSANDR